MYKWINSLHRVWTGSVCTDDSILLVLENNFQVPNGLWETGPRGVNSDGWFILCDLCQMHCTCVGISIISIDLCYQKSFTVFLFWFCFKLILCITRFCDSLVGVCLLMLFCAMQSKSLEFNLLMNSFVEKSEILNFSLKYQHSIVGSFPNNTGLKFKL